MSFRTAVHCLLLLGLSGASLAARAETFMLLEDSQIVGQIHQVTAQEEDTLADIARRYNVGYEEIKVANPGVDPWLPGEGTRVILPNRFVLPPGPHTGIVLNLAEMRMYYFPKKRKGEPRKVITHPVSIGRDDWKTPLGVTKVVTKVEKPTWYPPESVRTEHEEEGDPLPTAVPPGPDNPLGDHALRLALPGYLIHGTNKPFGIGMKVSHGCIRMFPEDIAALYGEVAKGTAVRIIDEPYKVGWQDDKLYIEAHHRFNTEESEEPMNYTPMVRTVVEATAEQTDIDVDWDRTWKLAQAARGMPFPVAMKDEPYRKGP